MTDPKQAPTAVEEIEAAVESAIGHEYGIERLLGQGGMAVVFLAHDLFLERPVALKVFPLSLALEKSAADRFRKEAQIAASLDHPHIAPIHRYGVADGFLWYTMKYIKGSSLDETLEQLGQLGLHSVLSLCEQAASALDFAHKHGVIHRDMKPANVMLDENNWAYVCDFGVAKAHDTKLTQTGGTIGTPAYMSPEQLYGRPLDGRSDQYSLAVMVFELLAGQHPFVADSVADIIQMHCTAPPPLLSEFRDDVPEQVVLGVERAMSKKPDDRFDSIISFLASIGGRRPPQAPESGPMGSVTHAVTERIETLPEPLRQQRGHVPYVVSAAAGALITWGAFSLTTGLTSSAPQATTGGDSVAMAVVAEPGHLWVSANPWGELYIDGTYVGNTPALNLTLGPGPHVIRVEREGFVPVERRIELSSGEEMRLTDIVLEPSQ